MKKTLLVLAATAAASVSCIHSKEVDRGEPKQDGQEEAQQKDGASPKKAPAPPPRTEKEAAKRETDEKEARAPAEEGRPELTTSADGLLLPEGPRLIQDALAQKGYLSRDHQTGKLDPETSAALRKFQADEEVARTGYPDRETIRRLGLSVAKVFKATGSGNTNPERRR
jgi:peptidoglycan hydrolase-like protein with peptidoglycan-binding domain